LEEKQYFEIPRGAQFGNCGFRVSGKFDFSANRIMSNFLNLYFTDLSITGYNNFSTLRDCFGQIEMRTRGWRVALR